MCYNTKYSDGNDDDDDDETIIAAVDFLVRVLFSFITFIQCYYSFSTSLIICKLSHIHHCRNKTVKRKGVVDCVNCNWYHVRMDDIIVVAHEDHVQLGSGREATRVI